MGGPGAGFGPPPPFGGPAPQYGGNKPTYTPSYGASGPASGGPHHGAGRGGDDPDNKLAKVRDPLLAVSRWIKLRSPREKTALGALAGIVVSPGRANRSALACLGPPRAPTAPQSISNE